MTQQLLKFEMPYYIAVFTAVRTDNNEGYDETAQHLMGLAQKIDGFLGVEFAGSPEFSISLVYWKTLEALEQWKNDPVHMEAKEKGKSTYYSTHQVHICKVEDSYGK
ncbi:MAG: antibiotic biosynthesis monooxygenase [Candidatus Nitronauta litoralis]|uniref:Antibiotic biosynthesis monooxygenase n=1 Tax=Candidatus Nitronauta litoralis TaxID=2705533 RepID=A0A7T0BT33_9BACT|nr:MAG: antibiotic biosynthesis monooxygenase [Candidatus Nitronauta litoralis]